MKKHHLSQPSSLFNEFSAEMTDDVIDFFIPQEGETDLSQNFYVFETISFKGAVKEASKTSFAFSDARWKTSLVMLKEKEVIRHSQTELNVNTIK